MAVSRRRAFLTSTGGLGIVLGSGIATIARLSAFPVSRDIGFSASVVVFIETGAALSVTRDPVSPSGEMVKCERALLPFSLWKMKIRECVFHFPHIEGRKGFTTFHQE